MASTSLWDALDVERPVQVVGVVNAYTAMLADRAGFRALYLSGSGVATASFGLPDLGFTTLTEVAEDTRRVTSATDLPLLVDADTGWGPPAMVERAVRELEKAGATGVQLEDQVLEKRCGHRPNKRLAAPEVMEARVTAAAAARSVPSFAVVVRTDALAVGGLDQALERIKRYVAAGADVIFLEAAGSLDEYAEAAKVAGVPILANLTEFGVTPLFTLDELRDAGVSFALYPLSAFRAMSAAAARTFEAIRRDGTQADVVGDMQTRADMYDVIDYETYERRMDDVPLGLDEA
ncbi:MAG TPA: methylisocitrate lyase [Acidimicrobiales bacterium]|nr:methylisocitrate lyase [Acidimicrobiales bacterium]